MTDKQFKPAAIKAMDDAGHGTAVFATLDVIDKDGDIIVPGSIGNQTVQILPTHDWGSVPLGKGTTREEDGQALVDFQLNLDTVAGKEWHSSLRFDMANGDPVQEWSFGFTVGAAEPVTRDGREAQALSELDIHEVSPVVLGAGVGTRTLSVKHGGDKNAMRLADQIAAVAKDAGEALARATELRDRRKAESESGRRTGRGDISGEYYKQIGDLAATLRGIETVATELESMAMPQDTKGDEDRVDDRVVRMLRREAEKAGHLPPEGFCKVDGRRIKGASLGRVLTDLRDQQERTNQELADAAGVGPSTMSDIVTGEINCPPLERLRGLAELLDVPLSRLRGAAEDDGCEFE